MLSKLQASINMLSEENRKILAENVQLRKENAGLQANLEEILLKQRTLLREVDLLRSEITKLTKKNNETSNQRATLTLMVAVAMILAGCASTRHKERTVSQEALSTAASEYLDTLGTTCQRA